MNNTATGSGYFLHVCEHESPWSRAVGDILAATPVEVDTRSDVCAALALMLKRRGSPCLAVFICLDWLDQGDHAFFDLVSRHVGPVPVWAYATRRPVAELAEPLQVQRLRLLEDQGQLDLVVSQLVPAKQPLVSAPAARRPAPQRPQGTDVARGDRSQVSATATPAESRSTPPVPWITQPARPTRTPPGGTPDDQPKPAASPVLKPTEPILTAEELDALTSDTMPSRELPGRGEP